VRHSEDAPPGSEEAGRRSDRRVRILKTVASIALGWALLVGVLPRLADLSQVWQIVRAMTLWEVAGLLAFSAWNILTYQFVMMSALPGLKLHDAFLTGQISTAVSNTVPAGALVGIGITYAVLSSFGHRTSSIALAAVLTGWWNTLVKFGLPIVALALLALGEGGVNQALLSGAIVGMVLLAGAVGVLVGTVASDRLAAGAGRLAGGVVSWFRGLFGASPVEGWQEKFVDFRRRSAGLLRRRWALLSLATLISHVSLFWVLLASLRALGVDPDAVSWQEVLGTFAFVRLATALPLTPGGLGIVEVGMSAGLVLAGGEESPVVAAVLIYRALTYLLQVILGVLSYGIWRVEMRATESEEEEEEEEPASG